jgi:hypothetical protein
MRSHLEGTVKMKRKIRRNRGLPNASEATVKNLLLAELLEQYALSNINRQSFSILSGLWISLIPKIHTYLHTSTILQ